MEGNLKKVLSYYDTEIHDEIPSPSVTIPQGLWQVAIDMNATHFDGSNPIVVDTTTLSDIKEQALQLIDDVASKVRNKYRSKDKDATYQNKSLEVDRWIAAGSPDPVVVTEFPYLYHEALETESSVTNIADMIQQLRTYWIDTIDPVIEGKCRGGKVKISNAESSEEIEILVEDTITALEDI